MNEFNYPQDYFCGTKIGNLTVIGISGKQGKIKLYACLCSECAKDPELHLNGVYHSVKSSLVDGRLPCGCSKRHSWNSNQYLVLISRKGAGKFELIGQNEITGINQKVKLRCLIDGHEWDPSVNDILRGSGCPCCNTAAKRKGDPDPIKNVINRCAELDITFNGFVGENYVQSNITRLDLECKCGNCWKPTYNNFITAGSGCPSCAKSGYNQGKQGNHYLVKWEHPITGHKFIKFGITNRTVKARVRDQSRKTDYIPEIIRVTTHDIGSDTAGLECDLKALQSTHGISNVDPLAFADGHTETLPIVALNAAQAVIDEYCFGLVLPR